MFLLAIDTSGILVIEIIIAAIEIIGAALLVAILFFMILPLKKGNQKPSVAPKTTPKMTKAMRMKRKGMTTRTMKMKIDRDVIKNL